MLFQSIMVFFASKLLIYIGKVTKKMTLKIMVFFGISLGMSC